VLIGRSIGIVLRIFSKLIDILFIKLLFESFDETVKRMLLVSHMHLYQVDPIVKGLMSLEDGLPSLLRALLF
jgi:hypothetical protein